MACLVSLSSTMLVYAQPTIRVRSTTRFELSAEPTSHGVSFHGVLLDDQSHGLPGRIVLLRVSDEHDAANQAPLRALRTASDGSFDLRLPLAQGHLQAVLRYAGEPLYEEADKAVFVDLTRFPVSLRFVLPHGTRFDLDEPEQVVLVRGTSPLGTPQGLPISLRDEHGKELGNGLTDKDGSVRFALARSVLGPPGMGRLVAATAGDRAHSAATTEVEVQRFVRTSLRLQVSADLAHNEIPLFGQLRSRLRGLANQAIGIFDGQRQVATVLTGVDGSFRGAIPIRFDERPQSITLRLQARYRSNAPWIGSSVSVLQTLTLAAPQAPSLLWAVAPLLLCAVILWQMSRASVRLTAVPAVESKAGLYPAAGSGSTGLTTRSIEVDVQDVRTRQVVALARCTLRLDAGAPLALAESSEGHFISPELADGVWTLEVSGPNHAAMSARITIPHRGNWQCVQALLQSFRDASVVAYKKAAVRMLDNPEIWERFTPRETLREAAASGRATDDLVALTAQIELAAFAREQPSADDVASIERRSADVLADEGIAPIPSGSTTHFHGGVAPIRGRPDNS